MRGLRELLQLLKDVSKSEVVVKEKNDVECKIGWKRGQRGACMREKRLG